MKKEDRVLVYNTSYNRLLAMAACYEGNVAGESPFMLLCAALDCGNPVLVTDEPIAQGIKRTVRPELADRVVHSRALFEEIRRKEKMPISWLLGLLKSELPGLSLGSDHGNGSIPHHLLLHAAE